MPRFNTRNPVPSTEFKDLSDNAQAFDEGMNLISSSFLDRFGNRRETWYGMEVKFNESLAALGYEFIGDYDIDGPLTIFKYSQTFTKDGEFWRAGPGLTLPYTTVDDWVVDQPKFVMNGDASLRGDLASSDVNKQSSLINFIQAGTGAIVRNLRGKLFELISTSDFGGVDNNATDNTPAINATKNAVGTGGVAKLVRRAGGTFKHTTAFDLNGVTLDNDPGLTLSVTQSVFSVITSAPARVARRLGLYFSDINANYPLYPLVQEDLAEKRIWLDDVNADLSYKDAYDLNALRNEMLSWPAGDVWSAASNWTIANNGGRAPYVNWGSGAANTWYRSSFPVRVGDQFTASFPTGGIFNRACFIQHAGGYLALYAPGGGGGLRYVRKDVGVAVVENNVGVGDIWTTQPQYAAETGLWAVKILNKKQFIILINGQQVTGVLDAPGDILRAGFGYMPQAVSSVSISGFVRTRNNKMGGRGAEGITIYGDSTWIDQHGGTNDPLRKALSGVAGTQVQSITNLAVAGTTAAEMYTRMQSLGFNGGTTIIGLLTNDIQGQTDVPTFLNTVASMFDLAIANNQTIVVAMGRMWYDQSTAVAATGFAGQGQGSANSANGAYYRSQLERLCADYGVKCVDLTQVSGAIDARLLTNTSGANTLVWDNIHKTPYLSTLEAIAVAKAIVGVRSGTIHRRPEPKAIPMIYSGGYSPSTGTTVPSGLLSEDGKYQLAGRINTPTSGVPTSGALVGILREDLWPLVPVRLQVATSAGVCFCDIGVTGNIVLDGYQAGWSWFDVGPFNLITNA